jgi:hypothetical protein
MRGRAVVIAALLAAACERDARGPAASPAAPAERPAAADPPEGERASGRRGDRHARAAARRSPKVKRVEGTLSRADPKRVVIRAPGAAPLTLRLSPSTTVTLDGRPAGVETLPEGAEVRASYRVGGGGRPTALTVEAARPAREGRREPAPDADAPNPLAVPSDG